MNMALFIYLIPSNPAGCNFDFFDWIHSPNVEKTIFITEND